MKIRIHNSLALKNEDIFMQYLLNDILVREIQYSQLFFWIKESDSSIGHLEKDGSLLPSLRIKNLIPFKLKQVKILGWKELDS